jgi:hypothetical protein
MNELSSSERDRLIAERDEAVKAERQAQQKLEHLRQGINKIYGDGFADALLRDESKSEPFDLRQAHARLLQALTESNEHDDLARSAGPDGTTDSHPRSGEPKG